MTPSAATHLMFTGEATAAMALYADVFPTFRVERVERYGAGEGGPEGTVKRADASLDGHALVVIDSPVKHAFTFTPSMSLYRTFETVEAMEAAFARLSEGGKVYMPPASYGFSRWFGWCSDRFGVSWQLDVP